MSLSFPLTSPRVNRFQPLGQSAPKAVKNGHSLQFAGEATDKFKRSRDKDPLIAQDLAQELAARQAEKHKFREQFKFNTARFDIMKSSLLMRIAMLQKQPLQSVSNPENLTYFDLIKLIQEKSDEHAYHFALNAAKGAHPEKQSKGSWFTSKSDKKAVKELAYKTTTLEESKQACSRTQLASSVGITDANFLKQNLNNLETLGFIRRIYGQPTGNLTGGETHTEGFQLTETGKAALNPDKVDDLVVNQIVFPSHQFYHPTHFQDPHLQLMKSSLLKYAKQKASSSPKPEQSLQPESETAKSSPRRSASLTAASLASGDLMDL